MDMQQLEAAVYAACLAAAVALGEDIKHLSWFGSNKPSREKAAA
jgi:hypothetical protein